MYSWIWRHIPFKQWQLKALFSAVLVLGVGAVLWYEVFPAVEPILPFDDVQVESNDPGADITVESPAPSAPAPGPTKTSSPAPQVVLPS
ncbi:hypothetical protein [Dactylosporangium sp. CA-233914]|uniref:hypothetical protein n=1 Tax=Dactylosporangium sp. CA-233914 TaxID=3239934 RepID=UPI003D8BA5B9